MRNERMHQVDENIKDNEAFTLSAKHKSIIDERIKNHHTNPDAGSNWKEVKQGITSIK
ncbi:MAG: addiction module protein [Flavobacteriales bacterium]|nr:addiction module protein [Flavobacteriales bacterium]